MNLSELVVTLKQGHINRPSNNLIQFSVTFSAFACRFLSFLNVSSNEPFPTLIKPKVMIIRWLLSRSLWFVLN